MKNSTRALIIFLQLTHQRFRPCTINTTSSSKVWAVKTTALLPSSKPDSTKILQKSVRNTTHKLKQSLQKMIRITAPLKKSSILIIRISLRNTQKLLTRQLQSTIKKSMNSTKILLPSTRNYNRITKMQFQSFLPQVQARFQKLKTA